MLDPGTKIRIKSISEIKRTLDVRSVCKGIYFLPEMYHYCDNVCWTVNHLNNGGYQIKQSKILPYTWLPEWFDVIDDRPSKYLNDGSIKQRSLCLALIRQTMVGNPPDLSLLINSKDGAFPATSNGGFNYKDFKNDIWNYSKKIAENIPDWSCLKLKPEILEEAIQTCLFYQHDSGHFKECLSKDIDCWFMFDKTGKSEFWYEVTRELESDSQISKEINIEQPIKIQENEIKFQRKKASILRGTVPEGNQQSSGKCKTTTCSGHLSYQVCSGR